MQESNAHGSVSDPNALVRTLELVHERVAILKPELELLEIARGDAHMHPSPRRDRSDRRASARG